MVEKSLKSVIYVTIAYIILYYIFLYLQSFITFYRYFKYKSDNKDKKVKFGSVKYDKAYADRLSITGYYHYFIIMTMLLIFLNQTNNNKVKELLEI